MATNYDWLGVTHCNGRGSSGDAPRRPLTADSAVRAYAFAKWTGMDGSFVFPDGLRRRLRISHS